MRKHVPQRPQVPAVLVQLADLLQVPTVLVGDRVAPGGPVAGDAGGAGGGFWVGGWLGFGFGVGVVGGRGGGGGGGAEGVAHGWFLFEANVDFSMGRGECEEGESEEGWGFGARFWGGVRCKGWGGEGAARGMRGTCRWARHMEGVCVLVHDLLSSIVKGSFRVAEGVR